MKSSLAALREIAKRMELNGWSPWIHLLTLIFITTVGAECPESGSCETCDLRMSTNLMSVNNVIMVTWQQDITFTLNFQQPGHNGFTFEVNGNVFNPKSIDPDFTCVSESDTASITETLQVQYHCTAMTPGNYRIEAYVYYCDRDYFAETLTVIVENDVSTPSALTPMSSSSASPTVLPPMTSALISSSIPSPSVTMPEIVPSTSSSRMLSSTSVLVSPSSTTASNNHHEGNDTVILVVTCVFTGLILAVLFMILLLIYGRKRSKNLLCCRSEQPSPEQPALDQPGDHHPMEQTQYGSNTAISETSNEASGSFVAASDYPTPLESVSVSMMQPEQIILSEPVTQEPDDARTPHQLAEDQREISTD